jgi:sulfate permease, SulP family
MTSPEPPTAPAAARWAARWVGDWVLLLNRDTLRADLLAGLLGAVLVLPQGIAFATLAGLPPQVGVYTAVLPCIVAALFGSSRHVMSGPTNAISLAMLAMLAPLAAVGSGPYVELAFAMTLLVGAMQLGVGLLRLGLLANFISPSALHGFTGGAAALIAVHALKDLLGLQVERGQGGAATLVQTLSMIDQTHGGALAAAVATIGVSLAARRWKPNWPSMLLGLVAGTGVGWLLTLALPTLAPVATAGTLPSAWPPFHLPQVPWQRWPDLLGLAAALTIVALGQSLAIAKAVAARSGQRLDTNREFIGQGLSNLVGGLFSSYVSCGSLNRSIPNLQAGARTPLAAVLSALLLVLLVWASAPLLAHIPLAAIGALLLLVAWSLFDLPRWRRLHHLSRREFMIAAATLFATLTMRLEIAILLGTLLSLLVYLYRTSRPAMRTMGFDKRAPDRRLVVLETHPQALPECPQLKLLRMEGSVYFGAVPYVAERLHELRAAQGSPKHLLVMAKSMNFVDLPGAEMWQHEMLERRAAGGDLYFHHPRTGVLQLWEPMGFTAVLGPGHLFDDKKSAFATIVPRLDAAICARCTARIFHECPPPVQLAGDGPQG